MIKWKEIYNKTLTNICQKDVNFFDTIVEQEEPKYSVDLVENKEAPFNSLYRFKLDDKATENDYKMFVEYIYTYIGEDFDAIFGFDSDSEEDYEI